MHRSPSLILIAMAWVASPLSFPCMWQVSDGSSHAALEDCGIMHRILKDLSMSWCAGYFTWNMLQKVWPHSSPWNKGWLLLHGVQIAGPLNHFLLQVWACSSSLQMPLWLLEHNYQRTNTLNDNRGLTSEKRGEGNSLYWLGHHTGRWRLQENKTGVTGRYTSLYILTAIYTMSNS